MVRLKVEREVIELIEDIISIPYGAIKSCSSRISYIVSLLFQFLMVRLKVLALLITESVTTTFQFLMVRLKGLEIVLFI